MFWSGLAAGFVIGVVFGMIGMANAWRRLIKDKARDGTRIHVDGVFYAIMTDDERCELIRLKYLKPNSLDN